MAGCSSGGYSGDLAPPSTTAATGTTGATGATSTTATTAVAGGVTVRGVVAQTLASARVVVLAEAVSGFVNVAFTPDTEVVRANGAQGTITDVAPGATIEVTGSPGTAGTLLARRVVLL